MMSTVPPWGACLKVKRNDDGRVTAAVVVPILWVVRNALPCTKVHLFAYCCAEHFQCDKFLVPGNPL